MITLPYLTNWAHYAKSNQANLVTAVEHLEAVMKQQPPIDTSPGAIGTNAPGVMSQSFPRQQQATIPQNPYGQQPIPQNPYGQQPPANPYGQPQQPLGAMPGQPNPKIEEAKAEVDR